MSDLAGACGDLGTFLPHVIGALTVAGLAPTRVLTGFGIFYVASGLFYRLPMAVQPMKAISAVLVTGQAGAGEVAAAGMLMGVTLLVLALSGTIGWLARTIPQSISAGLQLGLGVSMGVLGAQLMWQTPWLGFAALLLLAGLMAVPRFPAAPVMLIAAVAGGYLAGEMAQLAPMAAAHAPAIVLPSFHELWHALPLLVVPQLPLTLTNAIIVTALVSRDLFPTTSGRASERNLALSTGIANLVLAPLGAMPMCHGAGGVQAHYRFGARTGLAPVMLGAVLLILGIAFSAQAAALLGTIPISAVGALLLVAGLDLASSRRLFDAQPSCWPVIVVTAAGTLFGNPAIGLVLGGLGEIVRKRIVDAIASESSAGNL